jgi:hypothetical protein
MSKTITTYLIDGDPKGTQYVFISNNICQMYVIPCSNLSILNERQELQTPTYNNGWLVWKDIDGQTLDAVYRKQLE